MITIIGWKKSTNQDGREFVSLKVEGGLEAVQSQQTGRMYFTSRITYVPATISETAAEQLVGTKMPGTVKRIFCEPYDYTIKETGETVTLAYRYEYLPEEVETVPQPAPSEEEEEEVYPEESYSFKA